MTYLRDTLRNTKTFKVSACLLYTSDFWESMKKLGLSAQEIVELIRRQAEEE